MGHGMKLSPDSPQQYNISTFEKTDLPLSLSPQSETHLGRMDTAIYALPMRALEERTRGPDGRRFLLELHTRFLLSSCMPGSDAGWSSARSHFAPRRKEFGLGFHRAAGTALLHSFVYGHRAEPAGQALAVPRCVDGQSAVCCGGRLSAVADGQRRTSSEHHRQPAFARTQTTAAGKNERSSALEAARKISAAIASALYREGFSRGFSMPMWCESSSGCSCWCWRALSC